MIVEGFLTGWVCVMAVIDARQRRIPNTGLLLVLIPALLALVLQSRGILGTTPASSVAGAVILMAVTLPGYLLRRLGAGDVKFAVCLGLLLGFARGVEMLLVAFLLLGVLSLLITLRGGSRTTRFAAAPALGAAFLLEMFGGPVLAVWGARA